MQVRDAIVVFLKVGHRIEIGRREVADPRIVANVSGVETSSGRSVASCPWNASGILCLSANGAVRFAMLTCVEVEIAFTPSAFAIMNA